MGHIKKIPYVKSRFAKRWVESELTRFLGFKVTLIKNTPIFGDKVIKCDQRKMKRLFRNFGR